MRAKDLPRQLEAKGEIFMRKLYTEQDVNDIRFLQNKYQELTNACVEDDFELEIERKLVLHQIKTIKDMIDELGTEVPDDKARELGV